MRTGDMTAISEGAMLTLRRDLDQIKADLESPKHLKQFQETKAAEDLPALGRHYCVECAKYYESEFTLVEHRRGKPHKRRCVSLGDYYRSSS